MFHGRESDEAIDDSGAVPTPSGGCEVYLQSAQGIYVFEPDGFVAPFQPED